jgi:hypothetical protein
MPPRQAKYEDNAQIEKIKYYTKIFMYNSESFKNIAPIVEIIRNLEKSIIAYKYGKHHQILPALWAL